jgi:hypothetical protein
VSELLTIANSTPLWFICGTMVVLVLFQSMMFVRLCRKEANHIGYPQKKLNTAIVNGMITAIGPALAGVVVMISMMALMGGPITWQRLSIIGAAQTELSVATIGASVMGLDLGGPGYGIAALTLGFFLMAFNGCGWLLMTAVCTGSMETVRQKLSGGDVKWVVLLSAGASIGLFANFAAQRLLVGSGQSTAVVVGFATQFILDRFVAPRAPWLKSYALAISLIVGMIAAYFVLPV